MFEKTPDGIRLAEGGKANAELLGFLAKVLGVPKSSVELISGQASGAKTVLIRGLDEASVRAALKI